MRVNKTKFERNSSLEYYHMTFIGKTNLQDKEVYLILDKLKPKGTHTPTHSLASTSRMRTALYYSILTDSLFRPTI